MCIPLKLKKPKNKNPYSTNDSYKIEMRSYEVGENIRKILFDENLVLKK